MSQTRQPLSATLLRAALAAALIATIVIWIAAQVLPGSSSLAALAYTVLAAVVVAALLALRLTVGQWILRRGGTDTQWFWFRSEPRGLEALRHDARAADETNGDVHH